MKRRNFLATVFGAALVAAREAFIGDVEAEELEGPGWVPGGRIRPLENQAPHDTTVYDFDHAVFGPVFGDIVKLNDDDGRVVTHRIKWSHDWVNEEITVEKFFRIKRLRHAEEIKGESHEDPGNERKTCVPCGST